MSRKSRERRENHRRREKVIYQDKNGNYVFLDDVVSDYDPEIIDNEKLPEEIRELKKVSFAWSDEIENYVLCVDAKKEYL